MRRLLRAALGTLERPAGNATGTVSPRQDVDAASTAQRVRAEASRAPVKGTISRGQLNSLVPHLADLAQRHDRHLLIGYPDGDLVLALRPDRTGDLDTYLRTHAVPGPGGAAVPIPVRLACSRARAPKGAGGGEVVGDWVIEPVLHPGAFRLRVGLPEGFEAGLLTTDGVSPRPGWRDGCITIHRRGVAHRLVDELEVAEQAPDQRTHSLRQRRSDRRVDITPEALQPEPRRAGRPDAAAPPTTTPPAPAPVRPRSPRPKAPVAKAVPVVDETRWDAEEVKALLALLEERATAPAGRRRSATREQMRTSGAQALVLLHALARARGVLRREDICALLSADTTARFRRGTSGVTAAAKTLRRRGDVAETRGDVLTSARQGRRAGSNGVTSVVLREEFAEPLRLQARRMARANATPALPGKARTSANGRTAAAVPRQRARGVLAKQAQGRRVSLVRARWCSRLTRGACCRA